jgi:hypothetical protein
MFIRLASIISEFCGSVSASTSSVDGTVVGGRFVAVADSEMGVGGMSVGVTVGGGSVGAEAVTIVVSGASVGDDVDRGAAADVQAEVKAMARMAAIAG